MQLLLYVFLSFANNCNLVFSCCIYTSVLFTQINDPSSFYSNLICELYNCILYFINKWSCYSVMTVIICITTRNTPLKRIFEITSRCNKKLGYFSLNNYEIADFITLSGMSV